MDLLETLASARQGQQPVRERIWASPENVVVGLKIPRTATRGSYPNTDGSPVYFYRNSFNIAGGKVNLFYHGPDSGLGTTVLVRLVVIKKTLSDGREFLHVDAHPAGTEIGGRRYCRLLVLEPHRGVPPEKIVYEIGLIGPLTGKGHIIIADNKAKVAAV